MKISKVLSVLAVAGLAAAASAQETVTFTNVVSNGTRASGFVDLTHTFTNSFLWGGSVTSSGLITSGDIGSWRSEARIQLITPSNGGTGSAADDIQPSTLTGTWAGQAAVGPRTQSLIGLTGTPFNPQGQTFTFRFYESFNDGGASVDATWDSISIDFNAFIPPSPPSSFINLGVLASDVDLNTFGSNFDTELGLYDSTGALLGSNDDAGGGLQSQLLQTLADGQYYLAMGGFNTTYAAGWSVTAGAAAGDYVLNANSTTVSGSHAANTVTWFGFTVPTPGSLALAGMGGLLLARRRRA